jgi:CBS domain-containing protein
MATPSDQRIEGSYRTPSFEHATVADAMRPGVISCGAETPVRTVAQIMAQEHIHCVVVDDDQGWGVISDLDLVRAAEGDFDLIIARDIAVASDLPTVAADDRLDRAGRVMLEHGVAHLLVVDPGTRRPVGVLSTLDIAGTVAWGRT